ncbi:hypothetical protein GGR57DRAFT_271076 [Xylariaceae sp. FL1272]|nr:hypothetical protein GGR57DRAFT_271076 [Xylariaceae sp. FL1272]
MVVQSQPEQIVTVMSAIGVMVQDGRKASKPDHTERIGDSSANQGMTGTWRRWSRGPSAPFSLYSMTLSTRKGRRNGLIFVGLFLIALFLLGNPYSLSDVLPSNIHDNDGQHMEYKGPVDEQLKPSQGTTFDKPLAKPIFDLPLPPGTPMSEKNITQSTEFCTTWPVDGTGHYTATQNRSRLQLDTHAPPGGWKKPDDVKVVAVIFFGRRRSVDILDCYLRQNAVSNGGYLDEIWFLVNTDVEEDIAWLRELEAQQKEYIVMDMSSCDYNYGCIWEYPVEDDTIYIKIDDDILYIHHDAIPQLVHTRIIEPHPYAVSAQIVNSPVMGLESYHYGAIHPFLPDPRRHNWRRASETWKISELPLYPPGTNAALENILEIEVPYRGHPWLLLTNSTSEPTSSITRTPISLWNANQGPDAIAWGPGWKSWGVAAQQLYSLLWNLENNEMDRYHFGRAIDYNRRRRRQSDRDPGGEQLYDMQFQRYNLNFLAIWGSDVRLALPISDDENEITSLIPARLGRPFVVDTRAIVAHHSFYIQKDGIAGTDLMDRFRAFANENVCKSNNQKTPWDFRCENF